MSNHQFQHYRKAPHPYQQFGDIPPIAHKNRSIKFDYGSLPQGQNSFHSKIGKKISQQKYKSSIKNTLQFDQSLKYEISKHGKSLQTRDIEGAQGDSLKSSAVKYKLKAQQIKLLNNQIYFDRNQYEKLKYKQDIQNAIKSQHNQSKQITKLLAQKGNAYINNNNPEKYQKSQKQPFQKLKNIDYTPKNKQYGIFFDQLKSNQDNYQNFFNHASNQLSSKTMIQPKNNYSTIQLSNQNLLSQSRKKNNYQYEQKNYAKNSIQNQFKNQHSNKIGIFNTQLKQKQLLNSQLKINQQISLRKNQITPEEYALNLQKISKFSRRFNPNNLSTAIGPSNSIKQLYL